MLDRTINVIFKVPIGYLKNSTFVYQAHIFQHFSKKVAIGEMRIIYESSAFIFKSMGSKIF